MSCTQTAEDIDTISFAYDRPRSLPDHVKICLRTGQPFLPKFGHKLTHPPVDLSIGNISRQIEAEWLETAQRSQRRAYRKPPSLFEIVPLLTPYDFPFPQNGVQNAPPGPTSRRVLPPGEYVRLLYDQ